MNYKGKFGFYDPKTKKAQVYDGSKRELANVLKNGVQGFSIPKIFDGKCSQKQFNKLIGINEND